ncbi:cytochrome c oxidase assembly protein [Micromonospora soli]|uniref:cytochrome c oxidase assembly protein n=1 Tax=Micromonospora sp. NBRC 110009 TaxID=3061627 RepID=UPI0026724460|nr:cytochrome c oxidase assembly protein [Micromonospora sp. NBRC 110009]WKT97363.1 cytochrome c oxidase assembly protein [Micromonospora sp. NBRC 110009]
MSALTLDRAHGAGPAATGEALLTMLTVVAACLLAAGYGRGVQELWSRRGVGRILPAWRVTAFGTGVLVALAADQGPAHRLAEASLAGHMAQHMLLLLVAGPLLAAGAAGLPLSLAAPPSLRRLLARGRAAAPVRRLRRPATLALVAGAAQTAVLWFWHLPGPYVAAVDRPLLHFAEHGCFLAAAWLFWAPVLGPARHRTPAPVAVLLLVGAMLPGSALGAVLTFAPQPIYPARVLAADPLTDQQLAGLLMWAPMDLVALVVALGVFLRWLLRMGRDRPGGLLPDPRRVAGPAVEAGSEGMAR